MAVSDITLLSVAMFMVWFGCVRNTFVIVVFFLEYRRSRTLQPYEAIIILMALCNLLLVLTTVSWPVFFFDLCALLGQVFYQVTDTLLIFLPKSIVWLTAWLCFVYCVKIVKVNWRFFLRLKQKVSLVVKCLITGTMLFCFLLSIPVSFMIKLRPNTTDTCRRYYKATDDIEISLLYTILLSLLTSFLPLVPMLVSSLGSVIFLCWHSRNTDKNVTPSSTTCSNVHTSIAMMLLCLIAIFIVCTGTALPVNIQIGIGQHSIRGESAITQLLYSSGSPVILIVILIESRDSRSSASASRRTAY
ncbi:taste receptor type 2 member 40-like [Latimeria chalumnae]|uniref:taste receptor type 2 member 40-like n=1 Tax=Latimeria chalumnae TaxID=7897 RepID=UPI0003C1B14F|nr:PREDICTED: taste receptor type 2 member 40-like [Latimeria chalumnae]|eukprot:XP_006014470.1 PREDICTED: taste receptor type 2 member 40-like [Latimeria chalumnae]